MVEANRLSDLGDTAMATGNTGRYKKLKNAAISLV
jgi:hypothetical protein